MRKIKFRVWDGNLMHNVSELHFCMGPKLDGNGLKFYGPGVGQGWIDGENVHLMQYTGLKDKNGKEIYEEDIVKLLHAAHEENEIGQIIYRSDDAAFRIFTNYLSERNLGSLVSSELEVVGNIYENPELLEESK
ncbi:YopX family protein [Bacillus cereus]|uniref:YopX family protein n=1 Tax=Bacillus cereus TaxID=1396 RepID=UPI00284C004D|nr:YopX family protein [Bacillus cereus]MDR4441784.1 hypothetical protein [Bacillus cereus]